MTIVIRKILNKYSLYKLKKNINLSVCGSSRVEYSRISLKKNQHCSFIVGEKSLISASLIFEKDGARIEIGGNTFLGGCTLTCADNIKIGNNVQIAWGVIIFDHNAHSMDYLERRNDLSHTFSGEKTWIDVKISPTVIEDDVWIGANAIILKGVTVGRGAIVAAGSVVTKNVPEMTLCAGNPARLVRELNDRKNIRQ
jgi:acetyltransferase-like isoleucine patch superfamily enzyme